VAEATPAWPGATPNVPVFIDGGIDIPMPAPVISSGPSTADAYPECTPIRVSHAIPAAATSMPDATIGFGPVRGIRMMLETWANSMTMAIAGRNATPVSTGQYPGIVCR
jgi:hypothetical protein